MSRTKDFVNFEERQYQDIDTILENDGQTCDVYEPDNASGQGFTAEVGALKLIARILVKLSRKKEIPKLSSNGMTFTRMIFVGITNYVNSKIGQIWEISGKRYRVSKCDTGSMSKIEVQLERVE